MTRRTRLGLLVGGGLAALVVVVLLALPPVVRWGIARQVRAATGQDTSIADVDLNLFTRRLSIVDFRVGGGAQGPPLAVFDRLDAELKLGPLLRGRLHLVTATLRAPAVQIVRSGPAAFNISPVIEHWLALERGDEALDVTIEQLTVRDGAVHFHDRVVSPARTWRLDQLTADLSGVTSAPGARSGRGTVRFALLGAPVEIALDDVGLRPVHAAARLALRGLDLAPLAVYMPPDAPLALVDGRFSTTAAVEYDAERGLRGQSDATISDLALRRAGQDEPFVSAEALSMTSRDVVIHDGAMAAGRLELRADPTIHDTGRDPAGRYELQGLQVVVEDAGYPARQPAALRLSATLPDDGTLEASGRGTLAPLAVDLRVVLAGVNLAQLRPYLPAPAPVALASGQLGATLDTRYTAAAGVAVDGDVRLTDLVLLRRGQRQPFITHRALRATLADLRLHDGRLAVGRLTLAGAPEILDASVSPPQRFDVAALSAVIEDLGWPADRAALVRGRARLRGGATGRLEARVHPGTLAVAARATLDGVDLERFRAYLPADSPVTLAGRASTSIRLVHERGTGVRIDSDGAISDLVLARAGRTEPLVVTPNLAVRIAGLAIREGAAAAGLVQVSGVPTLHELGGPGTGPVPLRGLAFRVEDVAWPPGSPARSELTLDLPEAGRLRVHGTIDLARRAFDATVDLTDAALAPYQALLPLGASIAGRADAALTARGTLGEPWTFAGQGELTLSDSTLGPLPSPPARVERIEVRGLEVQWPSAIHVGRIAIHRPSVLVEREQDGDFPLLASLRPQRDDSPSALPGPSAPEPVAERPVPLAFTIEEVRLEEGDLRFLDRTTTPSYSEEITGLSLTVRDLASDKGTRAQVEVRGILGAEAALELEGVVAPFGRPFFLEVSGQLQGFSVPRTNPYLRRLFDSIARRGQLSTELHYRVTGDELEGTNRILVERLDVARAEGDDVGRLIGLPLALVVSLLKNPQGDIRLTIPVAGELGSPHFSFGDAILTALRNVLGRLVTAPLHAIGRVFGDEGEAAEVAVDPVTFEAGSGALTAEADKHLQRVADVLRASPYVRLDLRPVVTETDLEALRRQEVATRIQRLQRDESLDTFAAAAARLFQRRYPGRAVPSAAEDIVEALAAGSPPPAEPARELAARRLAAARQALIESAGIEALRLQAADPPPAGAPGVPRLEFELRPAE